MEYQTDYYLFLSIGLLKAVVLFKNSENPTWIESILISCLHVSIPIMKILYFMHVIKF